MKKLILSILIFITALFITVFTGQQPIFAYDENNNYYIKNYAYDFGNFEVDSDANGLADNWSHWTEQDSQSFLSSSFWTVGSKSQYYSWIESTAEPLGRAALYSSYFDVDFKKGDKFYYSFDVRSNNTDISFFLNIHTKDSLGNPRSHSGMPQQVDNINDFKTIKGLLTLQQEDISIYNIYIYADDTQLNTVYGMRVDNVQIYNLTEIFGAGSEPSIEVFENEYLTQCDNYFDTCSNYITDDYVSPKSVENYKLEDLNFTKSLIGYYGNDIDFNFYITDLNDTIEVPFVDVYYYGKKYPITLENVKGRYWRAVLNDTEKTRIKRILFDRSNTDNNYLSITYRSRDSVEDENFYYWFDFVSDFKMAVDVETVFFNESAVLVDDNGNEIEEVSDLNRYWNIQLFDNLGQRLGDQVRFGTIYNENLVTLYSRYTNVSSFVLSSKTFPNYQATSSAGYVKLKLFEIAIFSSTEVLLPNASIDKDKEETNYEVEYEVCKAYDVFCVSKNGFKYMIYDNEISRSLLNMFDELNQTIDVIPNTIRFFGENELTTLFISLFFVSLVLFFIKR